MAIPACEIHHFPETSPPEESERIGFLRKYRLSVALVLGLSTVVSGALLLRNNAEGNRVETYNKQYFLGHPEEFRGVENYEQFETIVTFAENILANEIPPEERTLDIPMEQLTKARVVVWKSLLAQYGAEIKVTTLDNALVEAQIRLGLPKNYLHLMG
jgi:hypothetical protein